MNKTSQEVIKRNPGEKNQIVINFLEMYGPSTFYEISKHTGLSSGAVQAVIKRLKNKEIFEGKAYRQSSNRYVRVLSINKDQLQETTENITDFQNRSPLSLKQIKNIIKGKHIELEDDGIILPLKLDQKNLKLIEKIIEISKEYNSIGELFTIALDSYVQTKVNKNDLIKAIQSI